MRYPLLLLFLCPMLLAQHNNRSSRDLQFRFGNPGARSLGFGGAFLGLADDATAPIANPAGMMRTSKMGLAFELNYAKQENEIPYDGGEIFQRNVFEFDFNLNRSSAPESAASLPFLSLVIPRGNFRFGFFAHQQANLERNVTTHDVTICHINSNFYPNCPPGEGTIYEGGNDVLDIQMLNFGGSFAFNLGESISLGGSVFYSKFDYTADSFLLHTTTTSTVQVDRTAHGNDKDVGFIFGGLWQVSQEFSLGLTYKKQPDFRYTAALVKERPISGFPDDFTREATFNVPDSLGIGVNFLPLENMTINLDAVRIYYSQLGDDFVDYLNIQVRPGSEPIRQLTPDVTELHFGLEWIFTQFSKPVSLRMGYWLDPYHSAVNNVEDSQILEGSGTDPVVRDIFFLHLFEEDQNHYSMGLGMTLNQHFQFDAAFDFSEKNQEATVSGIYRF